MCGALFSFWAGDVRTLFLPTMMWVDPPVPLLSHILSKMSRPAWNLEGRGFIPNDMYDR